MTLRNLFELMALICLGFSLYGFLVRQSVPDMRGALWVCFGFLAGALSAWLTSLRGIVPPTLSDVVAACLAMLLNLFLYWGFAELLQEKRNRGMLWGIVVPGTVICLWLTLVSNQPENRLLIYNIFVTAQYAVMALLFIRSKERLTLLPRRGLTAFYLALVLYRLAGFIHLVPRPLLLTLKLDQPVTSLFPVMQTLAAILGGMGFLWLGMSCLHIDLVRKTSTDTLTGLLNRRALEESIAREIVITRRRMASMALILLDLDYIKQLNDKHGHAVGDSALTLTAWCLRENLRSIDHIARLDGEEFVAVLPYTTEQVALEIAERLRSAISHLRIPSESEPISFTASFGVTTFAEMDMTWEQMLRRASRALERAKLGGRNKVDLEPTTPFSEVEA